MLRHGATFWCSCFDSVFTSGPKSFEPNYPLQHTAFKVTHVSFQGFNGDPCIMPYINMVLLKQNHALLLTSRIHPLSAHVPSFAVWSTIFAATLSWGFGGSASIYVHSIPLFGHVGGVWQHRKVQVNFSRHCARERHHLSVARSHFQPANRGNWPSGAKYKSRQW